MLSLYDTVQEFNTNLRSKLLILQFTSYIYLLNVKFLADSPGVDDIAVIAGSLVQVKEMLVRHHARQHLPVIHRGTEWIYFTGVSESTPVVNCLAALATPVHTNPSDAGTTPSYCCPVFITLVPRPALVFQILKDY